MKTTTTTNTAIESKAIATCINAGKAMHTEIAKHKNIMRELHSTFHDNLCKLYVHQVQEIFDAVCEDARKYWGTLKPSHVLSDYAQCFPNTAEGGKLFRQLSKQLHEEIVGEYASKHGKMTNNCQQDNQGRKPKSKPAGKVTRKTDAEKALTEFERIQKLDKGIRAELIKLIVNA